MRAADGACGFWMACIGSAIFAFLVIGFGPFPDREVIPPPPQRPAEISPDFNLAEYLVSGEEKKSRQVKGKFASPPRLVIWQPDETYALKKKIPRTDTPFIYKHEASKARVPERFSIELYKVAAAPETHLQFRQEIYLQHGYGGGFKIALEIVEKF